MTKRAMFVTIDQSPRPDIVPKRMDQVRTPLEAEERGALDGLVAARSSIRWRRPGTPAGERCRLRRSR